MNIDEIQIPHICLVHKGKIPSNCNKCAYEKDMKFFIKGMIATEFEKGIKEGIKIGEIIGKGALTPKGKKLQLHCQKCKHDEVLCEKNGFDCDCHILASETYEFPKCKIQSCNGKYGCRIHCPCDCHDGNRCEGCLYGLGKHTCTEVTEKPLHISQEALNECEVQTLQRIYDAESKLLHDLKAMIGNERSPDTKDHTDYNIGYEQALEDILEKIKDYEKPF